MSDMSSAVPFQFTPAPDFGLMRTQANTAYNNALAQLNQRRRERLDQSGFSYSLDPNGHIVMGNLDPGKRFGEIQMLLQQQGLGLQQNAAQQAQRGIGQYGMAAQQENLMRLANAAQQLQQAQSLQNQLGELDVSQQGAQADLNNQLTGIAGQQAQYQAQQAQYKASTDAQQQAVQQAAIQQQNFIQQLLGMLQGGGM